LDFKQYLKQELEKIIFIEIKKDINLNVKGDPVLHKGDYPILAKDFVNIAQNDNETVQLGPIVDGMIYITACDENFKYNNAYIDFLRLVEDIKNYIILNVENSKKENIKRAVIYATCLNAIYPTPENGINRVYLLMDLFNKTKLKFIEDETVESLKKLSEKYADFGLAYFHLGEYYLDKDKDIAKFYLSKCTNNSKLSEEANKMLDRIRNIENYDNAVDLVKAGQGAEALKTLVPLCEDNPDNLDAKYYMAVAYRQADNYYKALMYLEDLLISGELPEIYTEIALNLACLNDFESAVVYFEKALDIKPRDIEIISNIGVCYLNLGDVHCAIEAFQKVLKIQPEDKIASMWLEKLTGEV
jgi:tetratricopeptide (TPR) repeat protein